MDDLSNNERQNMVDYVQDWFSNKYGLKKLAEQQLLKMIAATLKYGKSVIDAHAAAAAAAASGGSGNTSTKAGARRKSAAAAGPPQVDPEKLRDANYFHMFGRWVTNTPFRVVVAPINGGPTQFPPRQQSTSLLSVWKHMRWRA